MYVKATFNNTQVTFTDPEGNVIAWATTGTLGFKGTRKSTPYAATTTIEDAVRSAKEKGISSVSVYIKGPGPGRDASLRVLRNAGLEITQIADITPIPHNGCRPKKPRRV
jgi:small subunit ribosomal protein S11